MEENKILLDNDNNITFGDTNKQLKLEGNNYTSKTGEIYIIKFKPKKPEKLMILEYFVIIYILM